ncbi:hypothetical protein SPWS13_0887 [Shewanella putrefaciens]|nr:hypothetical protein SPWS13_0887 [Shewanella putrefaciens]
MHSVTLRGLIAPFSELARYIQDKYYVSSKGFMVHWSLTV